jgi:hypothetical protein
MTRRDAPTRPSVGFMSTTVEIQADVLKSIRSYLSAAAPFHPTTTDLCRFKPYGRQATEQALRDLADTGTIGIAMPQGEPRRVTWVATN